MFDNFVQFSYFGDFFFKYLNLSCFRYAYESDSAEDEMSELSDSGAANESQLDRLKNANKTRWSKHEVRVNTRPY